MNNTLFSFTNERKSLFKGVNYEFFTKVVQRKPKRDLDKSVSIFLSVGH
ncbi:hypothetical protein L910_2799 [Vibrio fluvialis PG41]|uniref:Uncharacterized protein n=1 Tax=Vibrio fluvialis PG41 TaxID=1336752 RepID=S7JC20_VIBFL|nr:hypothetical protein L910_2799 [Vibrio fluvialis PG41]